MIEILTGLLVCLIVVLLFGNSLIHFGEDKNSPLMKTLAATLVLLFIACIGIAFSI